MELFSKPSSDRMSSCNRKPSQFSRRSLSLGPSEMVGQGGFTSPLTEGVAIDEVTRLERCPLTGDWRFVTISQDTSIKLKGNNCNVSNTVHAAPPCTVDRPLCLPQVRSGSADPKHGPRRRRYGSLKLEDMGIKIPDEINSYMNTDKTVKDGEKMSPVVTPIHCRSANLRHSLLRASEDIPTLHSVERDLKSQVPSAPLQAQRSLDYSEPENIIQKHCRQALYSSDFRANDGLLSERSKLTTISSLSPNKSNEDHSSILSSNSQPYLAAEHVVSTSENNSNDVFMDNSLQQSAELSVVNGLYVVEVGLKRISTEKDSNMESAVRESQSGLNDRALRSVSSTNFAVSEDNSTGSEIYSVGSLPGCSKTLDAGGCSSQDAVQMSSRNDEAESRKVTDIGHSLPSDTTSFLNVSNVTDSSALHTTSESKNISNVKDFLSKSDQGENNSIFETQDSFAADSADDDEKDEKAAEYQATHGNLRNTECNIQLQRKIESTGQELNVPNIRQALACSDRSNVISLNQNVDKTGYKDKIKSVVERPNSLMVGNAGEEKFLLEEVSAKLSDCNNKTLHRSFPCHDIALLAGNSFSYKTSEGKALFSNSSENEETTLVKGNVTRLGFAENVKGKVDLAENVMHKAAQAENVMDRADFTDNVKYKAVLAENMNDKAVKKKSHTATVSVSSNDDSDKLRIPQFVSYGLSGDLTSQPQQQESFISSPSKPNRDVVSDSFADSFATQDSNSNISLLSWLQQNSSSNGPLSPSARTRQSSSSMIPVTVRQRHASLPGNRAMASVEICDKPELSDSGLMSQGFDNSATIADEHSSPLFEVGVAKSAGNLIVDLYFSCGDFWAGL